MLTRLTIATAVLASALIAPAAAQAAALGLMPAKPCFRAGEKVTLLGSGFTPSGEVRVTSDGSSLGNVTADSAGNFGGQLTVAVPSGEKVKTYAANDQTNPALTATTTARVSALNVSVNPSSGTPGRLLRIGARGFTTGKRLYAHVVRGRYRRNLTVGSLRGACRKLNRRVRVFRRGTRSGVYTVQFDTRRRYSARTAVKVTFRVTVYRAFGASSAAGDWALLPR